MNENIQSLDESIPERDEKRKEHSRDRLLPCKTEPILTGREHFGHRIRSVCKSIRCILLDYRFPLRFDSVKSNLNSKLGKQAE